LRRINADGISTKAHEMLDERYISKIRKAEFEFHVWTIDDPSTAKRFANMGVLSITTNKPEYIKTQLAQKTGPDNG
jgi:glycerophosphoryl diester phosphodiesterase